MATKPQPPTSYSIDPLSGHGRPMKPWVKKNARMKRFVAARLFLPLVLQETLNEKTIQYQRL